MANKKLNAIITIGGAITGSLKSALGTTRQKLQDIGSAVRKLEREQKMLGQGIQTFGALGRNVEGLRARYAAITSEIEKTRRAHERLNKAAAMQDRGGSMMAGAGMKIGATVAAASLAFIPIKQAVAFETAMLGVAKQVEGARDASGKLTAVYFQMGEAIQQLGREIPIATNEIAEMVAAGARMGIAKDELISFTRTASMMASAFSLPAGELADQMGKIAGLYKVPIPAIGRLADTINYLDDNAISKGGDIIDFLTRVGGVAGSVKISGTQMAALGSTLLTLGERSETASTAVNAMVQKFAAADKGTKKFRAAMDELGLSTAAVQNGMQKDAQGTILKVMEAINKLPESKRLGVMVELVGLEHSDTVAKLATNLGEYRKQIDLAHSEQAKGSMEREFQAQLQTTAAQWEITKNVVAAVGVNIGSVLLPAVNSLLTVFRDATGAVSGFVRENQSLIGNVAAAAAGIGGALLAWNGLVFGIGAGMKVLGMLMGANPIGLAVLAFAGLAAVIWKNWEPIKGVISDTWNAIKSATSAAVEGLKNAFLTFTPLGIVIKNWEPIKGFFGGLFDNIRATVKSSIDWILGKINAVGTLWDKTKSAFGFGQSGAPAAVPSAKPAGPVPPPVPAARGAAAPGTTVNSTVNAPITINQQPGQNSKQLADEVARRLKQQQAVKRRGAMFDPALGY